MSPARASQTTPQTPTIPDKPRIAGQSEDFYCPTDFKLYCASLPKIRLALQINLKTVYNKSAAQPTKAGYLLSLPGSIRKYFVQRRAGELEIRPTTQDGISETTR
jgi:hypothetical protein